MNILEWITKWTFNNEGKNSKNNFEDLEIDSNTLKILETWVDNAVKEERTNFWNKDIEFENFDFRSWAIQQYKKIKKADTNCDCRVKIETLDNPGWGVYIYLFGTNLQSKIFDVININTSENDWLTCKIENNVFKGYGDPNKLQIILNLFKDWTEKDDKKDELTDDLVILYWLTDWYKMNCNGDWEHSYGIQINNVIGFGWTVEINLSDTALENRVLEKLEINNGENDWFFCKAIDNIFTGGGDINKLTQILETFKAWSETY